MSVLLDDVSLRVDGTEWPEIGFRFRFVDGFPGGDIDIFLNDPFIGEVSLSDRCLIEIKNSPGTWRSVTYKELLGIIQGFIT